MVAPAGAGARLPFALADLAALPAGRAEEEAHRAAAAFVVTPFDLSGAPGPSPLFRFALWRLGPEDHLAAGVFHHAIADGWSVGVLVAELAALYPAAHERRPSPLPPLPVQYADFATWQRRRLTEPVLAAEIAFHARALAGTTSPLPLPADRPRRPERTWHGDRRPLRLDPAAAAALRARARDAGATLYMALLAGVSALLARLSGETDFALGTVVAGRPRPELEGLIGFFVNTLPVPVHLAGDPPFAEAVARARDAALATFAHAEVPFERLVEALEPERSLAHAPIFQILLTLQNAPRGDLHLPGLTLAAEELPNPTAKFDLTFAFHEEGEAIGGELEWSTDLFDRPTAERLLRSLAALLAAAAADPGEPISALPLLGEAERFQLLREWGSGGPDPEPPLLAERAAAWARRRPEAPAVTFEGETLSYGELWERAGVLARRLAAAGVRPGETVALALERSAGLIVAILAIWRAGAAYLPLDPDAPPARKALLLADAGVSAGVGTPEQVEGALPPGVPLLPVEAAAPADSADGRREAPLPALDRALPAYRIYTSGSTGTPKGVVISHGSAARLAGASVAGLGFGPDDVWTLFHSAAFDYSAWEIWGALAHGGRLVVVPRLAALSPPDLAGLLERERVTVLCQTPSAFAALAAELDRRPRPLPPCAPSS